ncbi:hypothetical protein C548_107 [Candidatus Portiera aleyrodidarum BT-QVLC]|nr:hypothetical protein C548_107 [Candidatus Portiera aleyrodidarum BT-QVLC]
MLIVDVCSMFVKWLEFRGLFICYCLLDLCGKKKMLYGYLESRVKMLVV